MAFAKKKRKKSRFRRLLTGFLWLTFCLGALAVGGILGQSPIMRQIIYQLPEILTRPNPAGHFDQNQVTFLILGADVDYDNKNRVIKKQARSDTMFVVRCDFGSNEGRVDGISIPRDTLVDIPGNGRGKINAAHAIGGQPLAKETVEQALGVHIDHVLTLDFVGFQKMVDSMGGLYVNVDKQMDYDDNWGNLHIHLKPGYQWLNGYQAMGFVRYRHSDDDFHRIKRQQAFAEALKTQLKSQSVTRIPRILQKVRDSISGTTNDQQLISLAAWVRNVKTENIRMSTVPVRPTGRTTFEIDSDKLELLLTQMNFRSTQYTSSTQQ